MTTVSATINRTAPVSEAMQKRVWDAVEAMNYRPDPIARHLRSAKSMTVGLVLPDIAAPFWGHLAKAVHQSMSAVGYRLFLSSNDDDPERELDDIRAFTAHRVAGLVIAPTSHGANYPERLAKALHTPAVLIDRIVPGVAMDAVTDDNAFGASLLVGYLRRLGHRRIGFIAGRTGISTSDERLAGFEAAMAAADLPIDPAHVRREAHRHEHAFTAVQQMMSGPVPPTAIISINIAQTHGIVSGARNMGLEVPRDLSVVSFDGFHDANDWRPGITSLSQDIASISKTASDFLLKRIDRGDKAAEPTVVRVPPTLKVRDSAGPPPG